MRVEPNLQYLRFWRSLGVIFVLTALYLSLMPYHFRSSISYIDKIYHLSTYAGLMLWFTQVYPRSRHLGVAVGLVLFGIAVEFLQSFTGYRSAEWQDALANTIGVATGWLLFLTPLGQLLVGVESVFSRTRGVPEK